MVIHDQHPLRVTEVTRLAAASKLDELAQELERTRSFGGDGGSALRRQVGELLAEIMPVADRLAFLDVLMDRPRQFRAHYPERVERGRQLVSVVLGGLPKEISAQWRDGWLDRVGGEYTTGEVWCLLAIADAQRQARAPLPGEVVATIRRTVLKTWVWPELTALAATLDEPVLNPGEAWSDLALADCARLGERVRRLLAHAVVARGSKPTAKWERTAVQLLQGVGAEQAGSLLLGWLSAAGGPRTLPLASREYGPQVNQTFDPFNAEALRGLAWLVALLPTVQPASLDAWGEQPDCARALGALAESALRKVPGVGPREPKVANAAVYALSRLPGEPALAQLARLAAKVTFKGTLKQLNAALDARAAALGLGREEVEELAVPAYGLTQVGRRVESFGETTAELLVEPAGVRVEWRTAAGRTVKAPPALVRREHGEELKEFKGAIKDITAMLSAQVERLDRQFLARRQWAYDAWRERFLDHPLVGTLARRLIWTVDGRACAWIEGALRDLVGSAIDPVAPTSRVELWHPIDEQPARVTAWRDRLELHGVRQPFKQAHRELYLLTAAEETTRLYSNRFAAHILKQHQFHALATARGWRNRLRLMVDDSCPPATRELPAWGLRAEYWVEGVGDDWQLDTTEAGSFLRLATDQVRFYPIDAPERYAHASGGGYEQWLAPGADPVHPIPLADVPALVLSEVLRDVDLFVGVASVGNDPTWQDGGPGGRFREYWASYSFGELSETARSRADLLERLLPRLAIGERCQVVGRFLQVRGELRTYKIHLGSGNILMTPQDTYLCIVPGRTADGAEPPIALPFEGDRTLAVILSKALLLARDTDITDPTITQQLRNGLTG